MKAIHILIFSPLIVIGFLCGLVYNALAMGFLLAGVAVINIHEDR